MRFLLYATDDPATAAPPTPEMMAELGKLTEEVTKAGVLLATGGMADKTTRVRSVGGKLTVLDGPFTETKELTGGFALIEVKSQEEAIEHAKRFRKIVGDGESIIQRIYGPEDFGQP